MIVLLQTEQRNTEGKNAVGLRYIWNLAHVNKLKRIDSINRFSVERDHLRFEVNVITVIYRSVQKSTKDRYAAT